MKTTTFEKIVIGFICVSALITFGIWGAAIVGLKNVHDHGLKHVIENIWNGPK